MKYLDNQEKCLKQKGGEPKDVAWWLLRQEILQGIAITGTSLPCLFDIFVLLRSFLELVPYTLKIPGIYYSNFLKILLRNFWVSMTERRTNENPGILKNTDALYVINSIAGNIHKGNCRGRKHKVDVEERSTFKEKKEA